MTDRPVRWIARLVVIGMLLFPARMAAGELRILLKPGPVAIAADTITIDDVATVTGGTPADRRRIGELDLDTLDQTSDGCRIARRNIELRIQVDGFRRETFSVGGPNEVAVRCAQGKKLKAKLEELLTGEIARQFGLDRQMIAARLLNDDQVKLVESKLNSQPFTATVLLQSQLPIGKTFVEVEFAQLSGNRLLERFETHVIISLEVALATQSIARGTIVGREMVSVIKRPVQRLVDFADPQQIVGRIAKRDIAGNQVVLSSYLAVPPSNHAPIVKSNDLLDVIVKLGRSEIRLKNAKAMSSGAVGDTIEVLNTQSNQRLNATIVGRNLATVSATLGVRR